MPRCEKCHREAVTIYPLTGIQVCRRHASDLRRAAITLMDNAEEMVTRMAAGYLPEMRDHDLSMLRRIVEQEIGDDDRVDVRIHLLARKAAAHVAMEERCSVVVA